MKIEVKSGMKNRGKKHYIPMGINTNIKIDGKAIGENVDYFKMEVYADRPVLWQMGMIGNPSTFRQKLRRLKLKLLWKWNKFKSQFRPYKVGYI